MATDKSEPRVGVILKVGLISVVTLVVSHSLLSAYFDDMARAEEHRKFGEVKPEALISVRADESARLSSGPEPIERAMHEIAARGRVAASPDIVPTASKDLAPLQGWTQMPIVVPPAMTAAPEQPAVGGQAIFDAGSAAAVDAGAAAAEGGAAKPAKTPPVRPHPERSPPVQIPPKSP
jgi:hypothetical protein